MYDYLRPDHIKAFIASALTEDIGPGDYSTLASVPTNAQKRARLLCKSQGILAGVELAKTIFEQVDSQLVIAQHLSDGDMYMHGDIAFTVHGPAQSILSAERLVLNCMQRMCGIATHTRRLANLIAHTKARLLDTRKTTPNFRLAEKWAVKIGGGYNHRYGLFDMVMLKDNHIDFAGGITQALRSTATYLQQHDLQLDIVVEVRSLIELEELLATGLAQRALLDNMNPDMIRTCVELVSGKIETEASGGITELSLKEYAETEVDYISIGALTHSSEALDLSLKAY